MASASKTLRMKSAAKLPTPSSSTPSCQVKFIRPSAGVNVTSQMQSAFSLMTDVENAEWIDEEDVEKIYCNDKAAMKVVFICQEFSGKIFEILKIKQFRIIGPQCVIMCNERQEPIPKLKHPVLTATMNGIQVCCTSLDRKLRIDLHEKVQLMGGIVLRELTSRVSHLVCGEVGSKKYIVACKMGIKVMLPRWVEECYKRSQKEFVHASDPVFDEWKCPIFFGFNISVSNLDVAVRKEVQKLVTNNGLANSGFRFSRVLNGLFAGGIYSGELRVDVTTHLVLGIAEGRKFCVAKRSSIPCLKLAWIYESVTSGCCLDTSCYLIGEHTSSAEKGLPNCSAVSAIDCTVDETASSNVSGVRLGNNFASTFISENKENKEAGMFENWLKDVDMSTVSKSGLFLDGCKILLSGISPSTTEKLRRLLNIGGATRLSQLSDSVSHVIVGNKLESEHKKLLEEQFSPHVVNIGWIKESLKLCKPAEEFNFYFTSPAFRALCPLNSTTLPISDQSTTTTSPKTITVTNKSNEDSAFDDVIRQYKDNSTNAEGLAEEGLFNRLTFAAAGFTESDSSALKEMVEENRGKFLEEPSPSSVVDYVIVPIPTCDFNFKAVKVATNYWLQCCVTDQKLLDIASQPIYGPIEIDPSSKPLANCVICFTQYAGSERDCLVQIASVLGAKCQDYFTRQFNRSHDLIPNTHLVAMNPEGQKYEGAISWNIPVVKADWIVDCLVEGRRLSESKYLIEKVNADVGQIDEQEITETDRGASIASTRSKLDSVRCEALASTNELENSGATVAVSSVANADLKTPIKIPCPSTSNQDNADGRFQRMRAELRSRCNIPSLQNNRVKEVQNTECNDWSTVCSPGDMSALDTPGKFMNPNVRFESKLNVRETMVGLQTPVRTETKEVSPTSLLSLDELYDLRVRQALRNQMKTSGADGSSDCQHYPALEQSIDEASYLLSLRPLTGVVIVVSKKLALEQGELNSLAEKLGAKCKWIYEKSCTHFVFRGKANEVFKDLKLAKDDNKIIVSPEWIRACSANNSRLDESSYPYTYNPNMSLHVMNQRDTTPLRNSQKGKDVESSSSGSSSGVCTMKSKQATAPTKADNTMSTTTERKLDEIIAAAKKAKERRTKGASLNNTFGCNHSIHSINVTPKMKRLPLALQSDVAADFAADSVESVAITWEDPTSREEIAKLTARLQMKNNTLNSDDEDDEKALKTTHNKIISVLEPERVASPSSLKENASVVKPPSSSYVFMLTGAKDEDRRRAKSIIEKCGSHIIDSQTFDGDCTHLVCYKPSRSEKFLAAIAAGCWVLHSSYLNECFKKGCFVEEEAYEWANDHLKGELTPDSYKLCCSARKWRQKIQSSVRAGAQKTGAFTDWKVMLCAREKRLEGYMRLLTAGGATILCPPAPFASVGGATHAIIESELASRVTADLPAMVAAGVSCVKPDYICSFLSDGSPANIKCFYLPDAIRLLTSGDQSIVKRKSDDANSSNKRTRQILLIERSGDMKFREFKTKDTSVKTKKVEQIEFT